MGDILPLRSNAFEAPRQNVVKTLFGLLPGAHGRAVFVKQLPEIMCQLNRTHNVYFYIVFYT